MPSATSAAAAATTREVGSGRAPEVHGLQGATRLERYSSVSQQAAAAGLPGTAGAGEEVAALPAAAPPKFVPRERAVPSSSLGRVMGFAQLGSSLLYGTVRESVSRAFGGGKQGDR